MEGCGSIDLVESFLRRLMVEITVPLLALFKPQPSGRPIGWCHSRYHANYLPPTSTHHTAFQCSLFILCIPLFLCIAFPFQTPLLCIPRCSLPLHRYVFFRIMFRTAFIPSLLCFPSNWLPHVSYLLCHFLACIYLFLGPRTIMYIFSDAQCIDVRCC